ncbi:MULTISPECIES: hybrid sensor histidine kinase/response regulator [Methylobacter]|jgi:signal transduction histidine kinase/ActR/RegA family two-component response regulator|uniref:hybrid sensor histidine kinase/response regulator n=1 Tax=Methylobacter TaxID=429 RepID=UPI00036FDE29|nr:MULTISPECIES: ATP-binding protein [Methylobacter]
MQALIQFLFGVEEFMPHGFCFLWKPQLLWLFVISDVAIALAYFSIPLALGYFLYKRQDIEYRWVFVLFSLFIFACGATHLLSAFTIWKPIYGLHATMKAITAMLSLATAIILWPLIPKAILIPSRSQLMKANRELEQEIFVHKETRKTLKQLNEDLDHQVELRTKELLEVNQALKHSEQRFKRVVNIIPAALFTIKQTDNPKSPCQVSFIGDSITSISGYEPSRWYTDKTLWMDHACPDSDGTLFAFIDTLVGKRDMTAESVHTLPAWHHQWRLRHPSKGEIWLEGCSVPEVEADGSILWYGFIHDVTERKRPEEALREADRRKDEFLAMLAHELRNPLAPIRNAVQLMKEQDFSANPMLEWICNVIGRQASHMARLLDDLLDVARTMQGKISLKIEPFNLTEIVDSAVETCGPLIKDRQQKLEILRPIPPLWVKGDHLRLAQVLSNLLNNASRYTDEGGLITLSVSQEEAMAVIKVRDTGIGIAPEMLPHIFDLFTQADGSLSHSRGGLGVGLTLVRRLVEMHGGTASAASAGIGQGSEFTVHLPLVSDVQYKAVEPARAESQPLCAKLRILVVDDYPDALESLSMLLQAEGHDVDTANCGVKAVERAQAFRPQVVLLDIGLPDLDGYEVAQRLRELPETQQAVLVALTGYGQPEDRARSKRAGFDHHLLKPVDPDVLADLLASAGETRR